MFIDFLLETANKNKDNDAFVLNDKKSTYAELLSDYNKAVKFIEDNQILPNTTVALESDFSSLSTGFLFALIENQNIIVPLTKAVANKKNDFLAISKAQYLISIKDDNTIEFSFLDGNSNHEIYNTLKERKHPGIVFFSSGSTGESKGAVHDFVYILDKFKQPRKMKRMITFLMFDHMGGINTLLHNLSGGGCIITVRDRTPKAVLNIVEKYKVQVLPVSPTFINLMLLSGAYQQFDLSSLETISYGTEVMPESTLERLNEIFPNIRLVQTYGLSELGVMDTKSKANNSLWVKLGGAGFETRVRNNMLEIKAHSAMIGYLNAPSPYTEDGYFMTMDMVEQDGEYYKILGRKSEIINISGEKVYPAEVESFFMGMDGVEDVAVKGESNPLIGSMVVAKFKINTGESLAEFKKRMNAYAKGKIADFKIPQKVRLVTDEEIHSIRLKKDRK